MPQTYRDIFELNVKYIEYLLAKSLLSHQYIHNIAQSGADVENEVREMFKNIMPERFRITHGYIVNASSQNTLPTISPQVDMMIVDTLVPHSLFVVDKKSGMEIVPVEAVLAVFEIKRTLSNASLNGEGGALPHLTEIKASAGIIKNGLEQFGPGGLTFGNGLSGGHFWNPLLGIIGLDIDENLIDPNHQHFMGNLSARMQEVEIDIVGGFKGLICAVRNDENQTMFRIANPRTQNEIINYLMITPNQQYNQASLIARFFGYILGYLYNTNGKVMNVNNYFFNQTLSQNIINQA